MVSCVLFHSLNGWFHLVAKRWMNDTTNNSVQVIQDAYDYDIYTKGYSEGLSEHAPLMLKSVSGLSK